MIVSYTDTIMAHPDPASNRVRQRRTAKGWSQAELAGRVGVTQGYLSLLERGEVQAGAEVLLAISREFGKSVDWLLTGEEKK